MFGRQKQSKIKKVFCGVKVKTKNPEKLKKDQNMNELIKLRNKHKQQCFYTNK